MRDTSVQNSLVSKKYLETIRAIDGRVFHLSYHQRRLQRSLGLCDTHKLHEILTPPKRGIYRCRVIYDEDSIETEYLKYIKRQVATLKLVVCDDIEYSKKYATRDSLNELFALRGQCDDILIIKAGLVTDTSIANIALYDGTTWFTPKRPLLFGTTRERYIESGLLKEKDIFVDDLQRFTKVALLNAMVDFDIIPQENIEDIIC